MKVSFPRRGALITRSAAGRSVDEATVLRVAAMDSVL